jgi:hypothetical protein
MRATDRVGYMEPAGVTKRPGHEVCRAISRPFAIGISPQAEPPVYEHAFATICTCAKKK